MGLLDNLLAKLGYTARNVTAIGDAANDRGAEIDLYNDPLATWPDKIRQIPNAPGNAGVELSVAIPSVADSIYPGIPQPEIAVVVDGRVQLGGTWRFNEVLTNPSGLFVGSGQTTFTSAGSSFIGISHAYATSDPEHTLATALGYYYAAEQVVPVYRWVNPDNPLVTGWINPDFRTIEFGGEFPEMSEDMYNWFIANAVKVA